MVSKTAIATPDKPKRKAAKPKPVNRTKTLARRLKVIADRKALKRKKREQRYLEQERMKDVNRMMGGLSDILGIEL